MLLLVVAVGTSHAKAKPAAPVLTRSAVALADGILKQFPVKFKK